MSEVPLYGITASCVRPLPSNPCENHGGVEGLEGQVYSPPGRAPARLKVSGVGRRVRAASWFVTSKTRFCHAERIRQSLYTSIFM